MFFGFLKGRGVKIGQKLYGSNYRKGMPVPLQSQPLKWTAAMSFSFAIHCIALMAPLITDHQEPMWLNLQKHQR
jgi:hypothetical protein